MNKRRDDQANGTQRNGNGTPHGQRIQRSARKLDRAKVKQLAEAGMSMNDIAKHQNVHSTTVLRYLHSLKPDAELFDQFKQHRADSLTLLHAKSLRNQHQIQDWVNSKLDDDGFTNAAKPHHIKALNDMAVFTAWKSYEVERLERGQSTANMALWGNLVVEAHKHLTEHPAITDLTPQNEPM